MAAPYKSGDKLFARRDGIKVYFPNPDSNGSTSKYIDKYDLNLGNARNYKVGDEVGIFHNEVDGNDGKYLRIESWLNVPGGFFGDTATRARFVYVRAADDDVATKSQLVLATEIADLKARVYPEWQTLGLELPTEEYHLVTPQGKQVLTLKWANGYVKEYDEFSKLTLTNQKLGANSKPGDPEKDTDPKPGPGPGPGSGSSQSKLYGIIAAFSLLILVGVYVFVSRKRRAPAV